MTDRWFSQQSLYKIYRLLGRGGFGSVYLATEKATGNQVAIKEIEKRFECPYIVNISDACTESSCSTLLPTTES
jgi:serine/threonine protein kinase